MTETGPDVAPEAGPDVAPEAGPDVAPDRGPDVTPDAPPDAPADRGPDVAPDRGPDVVPPDAADAADAAVTLNSITVTPANSSITTLTTAQFTATGLYSNGTMANLTSQVTWRSSQTGIAAINAAGLATATDMTGTTSISATLGTVTGATNLTVTAAVLQTIAVTPANTTIAPTISAPFTAIGTYNNGSTQNLTALAMWSSSNTGVATINSAGVATGVVSGSTTIRAEYLGVAGATTLNVQAVNIILITVTPNSPSIPKGLNQPFTAVATFDDASTRDITATALWESSQTGVATINASGVASSVAAGSTIITAKQGGRTGVATLTVTPQALTQIVVDPSQISIADGTKTKFKATGIYTDGSRADLTEVAAWLSSDTNVGTVANGPNDGEATAVDPGDCVISASHQGVIGSAVLHVTIAVLAQIQVDPPTESIAKGTTTPFTATGIYTDGHTQNITDQVSWSSDAPTIATVAATGIAKGEGVGMAIIKATQGAISGTATLTVTNATLVSLHITPDVPTSIPNGLTVQFTATGTYTDNSTQILTSDPGIVWHTTSSAVANINATGLATADSVGMTTISASVGSVDSNNVVLTVTSAVLQTITVTATSLSIPDGTTVQFTAMGHYSDNTDINITSQATWTSATTTVATINATTGLATAVDPGTSVIKAALDGIEGTATLTVTNAVLSSITVAPTNPCIPSASTQQFIATGHFTDGSTVNLTGVALWASSAMGVATVSNAAPNNGLATAATVSGTQTTSISATYNPGTGAISGSTTLSVGACPRP